MFWSVWMSVRHIGTTYLNQLKPRMFPGNGIASCYTRFALHLTIGTYTSKKVVIPIRVKIPQHLRRMAIELGSLSIGMVDKDFLPTILDLFKDMFYWTRKSETFSPIGSFWFELFENWKFSDSPWFSCKSFLSDSWRTFDSTITEVIGQIYLIITSIFRTICQY